MDLLGHSCEDCGGTGSVRVHGAEDYGVSFECEQCEHCGGTGVDVETLQASYRGAVGALREIQRQTPRLPATDPVTGEPSPWTIAADYFTDFGGQ